MDDLRIDGPSDAAWTVVLAHGAGAPMDTPFMDHLAHGLAARGHRVVRFEFPYMARRRTEGVKAGPNPLPRLIARFEDVVAQTRGTGRLAVGGKSMGGRVATHIAPQVRADAVLVFGYPFHPPGKPERTRTEHLRDLAVPTLVVQGERDPFGTPDDVATYDLPASLSLAWMADGDHSLKPRKKSGHTHEAHLDAAVDAAHAFLLHAV